MYEVWLFVIYSPLNQYYGTRYLSVLGLHYMIWKAIRIVSQSNDDGCGQGSSNGLIIFICYVSLV